MFRFVQVELPWALGPPDGRYLLRSPDASEPAPTHVIVLSTLGAPERRRLARRRASTVPTSPEPAAVSTGRATIIDAGDPLDGDDEGRAWLAGAGEAEIEAGLAILNRALHSFRLVTADPYLYPVSRRQALVARLGYGEGEQVADGLWTDARELPYTERRQRRTRALAPQSRLAAVLGAREPLLATEELVLRARLDLDHGREREAALQLLVALDAALAELPGDPVGAMLADRLQELRDQRQAVTTAAQAALEGRLTEDLVETVEFTVGRIEAALRARAAQSA
jgi:hypothetical protein